MGGGGNGTSTTEALLLKSVKQTISVDGVLFVDGTFAGPDSRSYFESVREEIEARREIFEEIARGLKGDDEAMRRVELLATRTANSSRNLIKQRFASIILEYRKRANAREVLNRVDAALSRPQITLRRL